MQKLYSLGGAEAILVGAHVLFVSPERHVRSKAADDAVPKAGGPPGTAHLVPVLHGTAVAAAPTPLLFTTFPSSGKNIKNLFLWHENYLDYNNFCYAKSMSKGF